MNFENAIRRDAHYGAKPGESADDFNAEQARGGFQEKLRALSDLRVEIRLSVLCLLSGRGTT